ncbi:MAG: 4-hydroxy-tetrahydrodipicolinate reductase [Spirochaetota bacterium]
MVNVIICGAAGRMGTANISVFNADRGVKIVGATEAPNSKYVGQDAGTVAGIDPIGVKITADIKECIEDAHVIVDFTNCQATLNHLKVAEKHNKGIVIGTTGFSAAQLNIIQDASKNIPVLFSPNMSLGINTLFYLVKRATQLLGEDYQVEILEIHHDKKRDAPSGTAIQFGKIVADVRGQSFEEVAVFGRHGVTGERRKEEIGISALRLADVVGDHIVMFGTPGERIELCHRNSSRKTYASGALRAVHFIAGKKNGFFTMADVLGIM